MPRIEVRAVLPWVLAALAGFMLLGTLPGEGSWLGVKALVLGAGAVVVSVFAASRGEWTPARLRAAATAPVNLAVVGFLAWVGISLARAELPPVVAGWGRQEALRHLSGGLVYFGLAYGISRRRSLSNCLTLLSLVGTIAAATALASAREGDWGAVAGALENRQLLAGVLALLLPICAAQALWAPELPLRLLGTTALALVGTGLLLTANRSGWAGAVTGLAVLTAGSTQFSVTGSRSTRRLVLAGMLGLGGLALVVGAASGKGSALSARAGSVLTATADPSFNARVLMWRKALRMARDRPWTGWGPGMYPFDQPLYAEPELPGRTSLSIAATGPTLAESAHSSYFQLLAELGYPGLILYLGIVATFFRTGIRSLPSLSRDAHGTVALACQGAVASQAVCALASPAWEYPECSLFFWAALGLGMAAVGIDSRSSGPERGVGEGRRLTDDRRAVTDDRR